MKNNFYIGRNENDKEKVTVQEVEFEEIISDTIDVSGLSSQREIDDKIIEYIASKGIDIGNIGELHFSYGDVVDGKMTFSVSKVIVEDVNYLVEKEVIRKGIIKDDEDILESINKEFGIDILDDPDYEIVYNELDDNKKEYSLIRLNRTRLNNELAFNDNTNQELVSVNTKIEMLQDRIDSVSFEYDNSLDNIKKLMNLEIEDLNKSELLTDEELIDFKVKYLEDKLRENTKIIIMKKELDAMQRQLALLNKEKDNRNSLNNENKNNVLDTIDALYRIEPVEVIDGVSREVEINEKLLPAIKSNVLDLPERIVAPTNVFKKDYVPSAAPKDMVEASKNKIRYNLGNDTLERIVIYSDLENDGAKYIRSNALTRFNLKKQGEGVRIDGALFYRISEDDYKNIEKNANNDFSPYRVEMRDTHIKENDNEKITKKTIFIYRDLNDNNQLYASSAILNKFGIKPSGKIVKVGGKNCYKIDEDTNKKINEIASLSKNPLYKVKYVDVRLKKKDKKNVKPRPHVEAILEKLTADLNIEASDCKRFSASNIKVFDKFKKELNTGNNLYNIVQFVPKVLQSGVAFLRKISAKLMLSERAKKSMTELKRRLNEELSEEELDVLFEEYRGSQLKTDMNNQINGLILDRLREHGMSKVQVMNQNIKNNYSKLFSVLGQMKAIDNTLSLDDVDEVMKKSFTDRKNALFAEASNCVKEILVNRKDANNLLSGGVHGLEEDFKAVATKLSYVGMRFGKNNKFDNTLQHLLGKFGQGLNDSLANDDNKGIVDNFMGLESCYYDNTKISRSIFGKRSVGDKYYSPLAEQFDYRDDPFIRDAFMTVSVLSAATSAISAYRVHQIEDKELLHSQQERARFTNDSNDSVMDYVHQTGEDIESRRGAFQEGMKSQANQDVLNSANAIERSELDMNDWSFSNAYRMADNEGHAFYNQFHQDVSSQISDITAKYGVGEITQQEVLEELAKVSNNAQNTLNNVSKECLNILNDYHKRHPNFDLTGVKNSLDYINKHPDAIVNMNNAMVDVTNLAGGLKDLSVNHFKALQSLPSDMASTLVCASGAVALALNVSSKMNKKYHKKSEYGNEITDMFDDYLNTQSEEGKNKVSK